MTEATHVHEWGAWQPDARPARDTVLREARWCTVWACDACQIRPVWPLPAEQLQAVIAEAREEAAAGRCRASAAIEDVLRASERQYGDVPTPLTERVRQVLRDTTCDSHETWEAG